MAQVVSPESLVEMLAAAHERAGGTAILASEGDGTTSEGPSADRSRDQTMPAPSDAGERIHDLDIAAELKQSYLRYAMSVITL